MQFCTGRKIRCVLTKAESKKRRNEAVGEVIKVRRGGKRKAREETDEEEDDEEEEKEKENVRKKSRKRWKKQNGRSESGGYGWNGF